MKSKMTVKDRFIKYVQIDTTSDDKSTTFPSTEGQLVLLKMLQEELSEMGVDAKMDENGYVTAVIKSNGGKGNVGFLAHVDTSNAVSGKNVKPQCFIYDGKDIVLKDGIVIKMADNSVLEDSIGKEIITADGTTLLGGDDKGGVAEIMTAVYEILNDKSFIHGDIRIAFTPDEEIGKSISKFNVDKFGAEVAYTVDGGRLGKLSYDNFNAGNCVLKVQGFSVHPGYAKGKLKNAIDMFSEYHSYLPESERPNTTDGHDGYYMVKEIEGTADHLTAKIMIRDFDKDGYKKRKNYLIEIAEKLNKKYGEKSFELEITDAYKNMKDTILKNKSVLDNAIKAYRLCGVEPFDEPVRGGTDGAWLAEKGLPCPNLSVGVEGVHGKKEIIPVESLYKMVEVIKKLIELYN